MSVKPIPDGYHSLTPYLIVKQAGQAIEFYKQAFAATELMRLDGEDGQIMHAEMQIGDSRFMLADEFPQMGAVAPQTPGSAGLGLCLYVDDVDATFATALQAGAEVQRPVTDQFYGDRSGTITDPFNHQWTIATHIEDVSDEEIQRRLGEMTQQGT